MLTNFLVFVLSVGARTIGVGDAMVDPGRLVPYRATWRNLSVADDGTEVETAVLTERLERVELEGRPTLRQIQTVEPLGGPASKTTILFDARTLAIVRRETVSPSGQVRRTDYDWAKGQSSTRIDDGEPSPPTAIEPEFFVGRPGLVLAALPLAEGFSARIPFGLAPQRWWVTARVTGSTRFDPGDGAFRDAWIVETDWEQVLDPHAVYTGDLDAGSGGGTWLFFKRPPPGTYSLAQVHYRMHGPDIVIEMRDGLGVEP